MERRRDEPGEACQRAVAVGSGPNESLTLWEVSDDDGERCAVSQTRVFSVTRRTYLMPRTPDYA